MTDDSVAERVGRILIGGFGDRVAIGYLFGYLEEVTPDELYSYIKDNKSLFENVSEEDWAKWRGLARTARIGEITLERILKEFRKRRFDLVSVIENCDPEQAWIEAQVSELHKKIAGS